MIQFVLSVSLVRCCDSIRMDPTFTTYSTTRKVGEFREIKNDYNLLEVCHETLELLQAAGDDTMLKNLQQHCSDLLNIMGPRVRDQDLNFRCVATIAVLEADDAFLAGHRNDVMQLIDVLKEPLEQVHASKSKENAVYQNRNAVQDFQALELRKNHSRNSLPPLSMTASLAETLSTPQQINQAAIMTEFELDAILESSIDSTLPPLAFDLESSLGTNLEVSLDTQASASVSDLLSHLSSSGGGSAVPPPNTNLPPLNQSSEAIVNNANANLEQLAAAELQKDNILYTSDVVRLVENKIQSNKQELEKLATELQNDNTLPDAVLVENTIQSNQHSVNIETKATNNLEKLASDLQGGGTIPSAVQSDQQPV